MNQWTKIRDDFWIVEMEYCHKAVREALLETFKKENIKLVVLSDKEK